MIAQRRLVDIVGETNVIASPQPRSSPSVLTVMPGSIAEVCEAMKLASSESWTTMPAGAMTWLGVDAALNATDIIVSTRRLNHIIEHEPADLVAITQAGVTLKDFNAQLSFKGQWLPIDPPDEGSATIGGIVGTGLGGAQQLGYGPPRRHVIGMKVVMADGSLVKAGSRVVKNVAGYDMCKLFTGSYGTLGTIVEVNFKLRPLPFTTRTVLFAGRLEELVSKAQRIIQAPLFPVAVEMISPRLAPQVTDLRDDDCTVLMIRFAGSEAAVAAQVASVREVFGSDNGLVEDDETTWTRLAAVPIRFSERLMWRVGLRPTEAASFLIDLVKTADDATLWHAGLGDGRIRVIEDSNAQDGGANGHIDRLRINATALGGTLILEASEASMSYDSSNPPAAKIMARIKQQLDPLGILPGAHLGLEMRRKQSL